MWDAFSEEYLARFSPWNESSNASSPRKKTTASTSIVATVKIDGWRPRSAVPATVRWPHSSTRWRVGFDVAVLDYSEHAMSAATTPRPRPTSRLRWADARYGRGIAPSITTASLRAVVSAVTGPPRLTAAERQNSASCSSSGVASANSFRLVPLITARTPSMNRASDTIGTPTARRDSPCPARGSVVADDQRRLVVDGVAVGQPGVQIRSTSSSWVRRTSAASATRMPCTNGLPRTYWPGSDRGRASGCQRLQRSKLVVVTRRSATGAGSPDAQAARRRVRAPAAVPVRVPGQDQCVVESVMRPLLGHAVMRR